MSYAYFIKDYNSTTKMAVVSDMLYGESDQVVNLSMVDAFAKKQIMGIKGKSVKTGVKLLVECLVSCGVPHNKINPLNFNGSNLVLINTVDPIKYSKFHCIKWAGGQYPCDAICADDSRNMKVVAELLNL